MKCIIAAVHIALLCGAQSCPSCPAQRKASAWHVFHLTAHLVQIKDDVSK